MASGVQDGYPTPHWAAIAACAECDGTGYRPDLFGDYEVCLYRTVLPPITRALPPPPQA